MSRSCRSPLGLRGLKLFLALSARIMYERSQPSWAAWIEIVCTAYRWRQGKSQPSWAAWIEIAMFFSFLRPPVSQPSWAAWIEILV